MPTDAPTRPKVCCHCRRRGTLTEHQTAQDGWDRCEVVSWQCVYCGAVQEAGVHKTHFYGIEQIVLAPGELEHLREQRRKGRGTHHAD